MKEMLIKNKKEDRFHAGRQVELQMWAWRNIMDNAFKKVITVILLVILGFVALRIIGAVLGVLIPLAILALIGYIVFRLINKTSSRKF